MNQTVAKEADKIRHFEPIVELIDSMGTDHRVVNAARVSFAKQIDEKGSLSEGDKKLISYLAKHSHVTPFFHPVVCFRMKMPISVAREYYRHTVGFARNEVSRRYVTSDVECFLPKELREVHLKKKQGSKDSLVANHQHAVEIMQKSLQESTESYRKLLHAGVCPEQARLVLPQSMMTEFIETGSLAAYARMYNLRSNPDAQYEVRMYALRIGEILQLKFPVSWAALTAKK